jgi:formate C-acetyltransferase
MFKGTKWKEQIDVEDFILNNYHEYKGDESFLVGVSDKTKKVWEKCETLLNEELNKGILDVETKIMSGINNFNAGYIDEVNEVIVGLQTDKPLKRIVNPYGGIRMVHNALYSYGYSLDKDLDESFQKYRKNHNDGVFDAYTKEIKRTRKSGLITGLPDAYGRGRIIGDYRRVALYGIDFLIENKKQDLLKIKDINEESIRLREEINEQINALKETKEMALKYKIDISKPALNAKEATQWLYFAYLASVKESNGAAMSLGRTSTFLDIYIEKDLQEGLITELEAQEIIDQFIIKLRLVRHLRTPDYNELFAGDPTWVTESIGGLIDENRSLVTKNSFRYLNTLINLGPAPEPNMTVLWSSNLPENFKKYCAYISIKTDAIQYENDDLMRPMYGVDYAIACCVSAMTLGKQMQFFGARMNIAKALLYAINGGYDEMTKELVIEGIDKIEDEYLDYDKVMHNYYKVLEKSAKIYVDAMNIIHYMHDKYAYERIQMALHDYDVEHLMAFGAAGLSVVADSLSAIKHAKVKVIKDENNFAYDYEIIGEYPQFGNDNDLVDSIAVEVVTKLSNELKKHKLYKNAYHTLSILTITSNVVYGKKTGSTPDGRKAKEAFAPGANPMHGRDVNGALASLNSVAKIPYKDVCEDGVSNTFSIIPSALGKEETSQKENLVNILDGYFKKGGHHLNVNVFNKDTLIDAMNNKDKYPSLTIRVSGYAVLFNRLNEEQQLEVISRTFHGEL